MSRALVRLVLFCILAAAAQVAGIGTGLPASPRDDGIPSQGLRGDDLADREVPLPWLGGEDLPAAIAFECNSVLFALRPTGGAAGPSIDPLASRGCTCDLFCATWVSGACLYDDEGNLRRAWVRVCRYAYGEVRSGTWVMRYLYDHPPVGPPVEDLWICTYDNSPVQMRAQGAGADRYSGLAQREMDAEDGLQYTRARHYDPSTGRFIQRDPVKGSCEYLYAGLNPLLNVDPSGLKFESIAELIQAYKRLFPDRDSYGRKMLEAFGRRFGYEQITLTKTDTYDVSSLTRSGGPELAISKNADEISGPYYLYMALNESVDRFIDVGGMELTDEKLQEIHRKILKVGAKYATSLAEAELATFSIVNPGANFAISLGKVSNGDLVAAAGLIPVFGVGALRISEAVVQKFQLHHVIPKFLGGLDEAANLAELGPLAHRGYHALLREELQAANFPRQLMGGSTGSKAAWAAYFATNEGSQGKAFFAVLHAAVRLDEQEGTTLATEVVAKILAKQFNVAK